MPDLSQFPLKKGVSLLNSGFTPLGSQQGTSFFRRSKFLRGCGYL